MAAYDEEERRRKNYGKELPPITLSNTSISGLVTLIPILVSLTSQGQNPRFDDENDKPVWWPPDIQWQNPKSYSAYMGKNILKILRKVVHSCYSYHGVEDLLCRLDETSLTDAEEDEDMESVITISEPQSITISEPRFMEEEGPASCSSSSDSLVFVCCFCLEEFGSHDQVTGHQSLCRLRFQIHNVDDEARSPNESDSRDSPVKPSATQLPKMPPAAPYPVSLHKSNGLAGSGRLLDTKKGLSDRALHKRTAPAEKSSHCVKHRAPTASQKPASVPPTTGAAKKQSSAFVPNLKTRSQKKLDQIMEKHHSRKLMRTECQRMKGLAESGAWWVGRRHRQEICASSPHPSSTQLQPSFLSNLGLTVKVSSETPVKEDVQKTSVDLDCEIVLVEGPLSSQPVIPETHHSLSPRGSRSLMSQLSRDSDLGSRRRLSFCFVEDEWADKEALEEGRDPLQMSLLTIDLSSPLGQRIKKYAKADGPPVTIIRDSETYCKTEIKDDSYSRLRFRAMDYRVTYRKKCRGSTYVHMYKFNRWDVHEFKTRLKTGLSARSRHLQCKMKFFRVLLRRMGEDEIKRWTEEKKVSITENIIYDDDLCLTQIEIPESKVKGYLTPNVKPSTPPSQHTCSTSVPHRPRPGPHRHPNQPSHTSGSGTNFTHLSSQKSVPPALHPSLYLNHSSSPPHVPNIFRNRSVHNTSPPCPNPGKAHFAQRPHHKLGPAFYSRPGHERNVSRHESSSATKPHIQKSNRASPTSGFSSGLIIHERRPLTPTSSGSSRRKQVMTQVRQDEHEVNCPNKGITSTHSKRGGFVNLSSFSSLPSKPNSSTSSLSRSSSSPSISSSKSSARNSNTHHQQSGPPSVPRLSNFEYLSIRQGLLSSGHSLADTRCQNKKSTRPNQTHSNSSAHFTKEFPNSRSLPAVHPAAQQKRSVTMPTSANRMDNAARPHNPHKSSTNQITANNKHQDQALSAIPQPKVKPAVPIDDDVLEVICIDD